MTEERIASELIFKVVFFPDHFSRDRQASAPPKSSLTLVSCNPLGLQRAFLVEWDEKPLARDAIGRKAKYRARGGSLEHGLWRAFEQLRRAFTRDQAGADDLICSRADGRNNCSNIGLRAKSWRSMTASSVFIFSSAYPDDEPRAR